MSNHRKTAQERFKEKVNSYKNLTEATSWLEENLEKVKTLFNNSRVFNFVFEPFKAVFQVSGLTTDDKVKSAITKVAVINAVLAGLPGKMGIGVTVSIGFEIWLAFIIAKMVGLSVNKPSDVIKYFGLLAGTYSLIFIFMKEIIGFGFTFFSFVPFNPLIPAEIFATDLIGILFYVGFKEAKEKGSFLVPRRALTSVFTTTLSLCKYQLNILKAVLTPSNIKLVGQRLMSFLKGDIVTNMPAIRGELFVPSAFIWLLAKDAERLDGKMGELFLDLIRQAVPSLENSSVDEISDHFSEFSSEQMLGIQNLIKGQMFERLVELYENADGDEWSAQLHEDRNVPGSDIVFTNDFTGEQILVSLKATDNPYYINDAFGNYPDIPIMSTEEVSAFFEDSEALTGSVIKHSYVKQITADNFDELFWQLPSFEDILISGMTFSTALSLYPFVIAFMRKKITQEQLTKATIKVFGDSGKSLAIKLSYSVVFGPIFAWYLLAKAVGGITDSSIKVSEQRKRLVQEGDFVKVPPRVTT